MSRSRCRSTSVGLAMVVAFALASIHSPSMAQFGGSGSPPQASGKAAIEDPRTPQAQAFKLKEPGEPAPALAAGAGQTQPTRTTTAGRAPSQPSETSPVKVLIITGDHGHAWKDTTRVLNDFLSEGGRIKVDTTTTPSKDLTDENLAKYDVLLLNYKDTARGAPETRWSEANKEAFLKAVRQGKGLVVYHHASSAFTEPNWDEFEKATAGGWRSQGNHGPKLEFVVKKTDVKHPISEGLPSQFNHVIDELYQNSVLTPGSEVLATAYSDPSKPKGTNKDEPVIWVNRYGKGRVYENALGHDAQAMADPEFQKWMRRGVIWAGTGQGE